MLLFIDESGFDHSGTQCEVLAGVAVEEDSLWNLVRAVRGAERELFGDYLRTFLVEERKAKRLLKPKRFKSANRDVPIASDELTALAHSALINGKAAREQKLDHDGTTERELVAYSRQVLRFVQRSLEHRGQLLRASIRFKGGPERSAPTQGNTAQELHLPV